MFTHKSRVHPQGNGCNPSIVLLDCGPRARVAEWQTQWTQNPPRAISCGFNSRPGHQTNVAHATRCLCQGSPDFAYFPPRQTELARPEALLTYRIGGRFERAS